MHSWKICGLLSVLMAIVVVREGAATRKVDVQFITLSANR